MRLKQFINESRGKVLSLDDTKKLLQTKCKKAVEEYKKGNIIYRGINNYNNYLYIQPSKSTRVSLNTENYYTLINDNSPSWEKYPKRSKSVICTTDLYRADNYGDIYIVFPFDNAKIGVCSNVDYWWSFPFLKKVTSISSMDDFNYQLRFIFNLNYIKKYTGDIDQVQTYDDLKRLFYLFDDFIKTSDSELEAEMEAEMEDEGLDFEPLDYSPTLDLLQDENRNILLLKEYDKFMNMEKYIQYLLDSKKNKFELKKIGDKLPPKREIWTDSDSVLVHESMINEILP